MTASSAIPEDLRTDILGARRRILFVEGTNVSLDRPLYALLFSEISVAWVEGLRSVPDLHVTEPYGLVDGDGMSPVQIQDLEARQVFPLRMFSVECLYYGAELRAALACQQSRALGIPVAELLDAADDAVINAVSNPLTLSHLAARLAERALRADVIVGIPDRNTLASSSGPITLSLTNKYSDEMAALNALIGTRDVDAIINRYPLRESGALNGIARALHFRDRQDYEKAILARIDGDDALATAIRAKFGSLEPLLV